VGFLAPDGSRDPNLPLEVMVRHVDHLVERLGIDGVALGSDFDWSTMPTDLKDAAHLPNLMNALAGAGYNAADLGKIGYRNWLRVRRLTWGGGLVSVDRRRPGSDVPSAASGRALGKPGRRLAA